MGYLTDGYFRFKKKYKKKFPSVEIFDFLKVLFISFSTVCVLFLIEIKKVVMIH